MIVGVICSAPRFIQRGLDIVGSTVVAMLAVATVRRYIGHRREPLRNTAVQPRRIMETFEPLIEEISDAVTLHNYDGSVRFASHTTQQIFGDIIERFIGLNGDHMLQTEDAAGARRFWKTVQSAPGRHGPANLRVRHRDGHWLDVEVIANNKLDDPAVGAIIVTSRDITARKSTETRLAHQAFHDGLTKLPNRALIEDRLEQALARARRRHELVSVLFLDLDKFKRINDRFGHAVGDDLLINVGMRLQGCLRPADSAGRLGGDEFAIVLEQTKDVSDAVLVAQRITEELQSPFQIGGNDIQVTASIGIAIADDDYPSGSLLLSQADAAMYEAKRKGGGQYALSSSGHGQRAAHFDVLASDLEHALAAEQFKVFYQPIVSLKTGKVQEVEAFVRWDHPHQGMLPATQFMPVAVEIGMGLPIAQWVLEEACRQGFSWQQEYAGDAPLVIRVNLLEKQLHQPNFVSIVAQILRDTKMAPPALQLEIPEQAVGHENVRLASSVRALKAMGVRVGVDHVGTGMSVLTDLVQFPVDSLDLDRGVVDGLDEVPQDTALVHAILAYAKALNLRVTGEGIETSRQLERLRELGCDHGQGYYFSVPQSSDAISSLLAASSQS